MTTREQHVDNLRAIATVDDANAYVATLDNDTIDAILPLAGITRPPATLRDKRARIVQQLVGARLKFKGLRSW